MFVRTLLFVVCWTTVAAAQSLPPPCGTATVNDYLDPTHGYPVRQLVRLTAEDHNLYHWRNVFNADNTRMLGVRESPDHSVWTITLYDGNGCYIADLYTLAQARWELVWDKINPNIFYTYGDGARKIFRYDVSALPPTITTVKDFVPAGDGIDNISQSPSINQDGTRLLVVTGPGRMWRSWRIPQFDQERAFTVPDMPATCDFRHGRYAGFQNYIIISCRDNTTFGSWIYDDDGTFIRNDAREHAHTGFTGTGKWMKFNLVNTTFDFTVEDLLTGANKTTIYSGNSKIGNIHISCPPGVPGPNEWCIIAYFTKESYVPSAYVPPIDEIQRLHVNGTREWLARTGASETVADLPFWFQPQPSVAEDGSRVSFNSNCLSPVEWPGSGVPCIPSGAPDWFADQYVLFLADPIPPEPPVPLAKHRRALIFR